MKHKKYDLGNKKYNYSNIKYQILYYFENIQDVKFEDNVMILTYDEEYDDITICQIIDDNEIQRDIKVQPLQIEYHYLKLDEIQYIQSEVSKIYQFLADHTKTKLEYRYIISSQGVNITTGTRLAFKQFVDNIFNRILIRLFEAEEYEVPSIIDIGLIQKCNYLHGSFHHVNYISKIQHKYDTVKKFKNETITDEVPREYLTNSKQVLNPAICLHCYPLLKNKNIGSEKYAYSVTGNAYRDESGNLNNSIRLKEFLVREFVFISNKRAVDIAFNKVLEMLKVIGEELKLDYKLIPATDIFFDDDIGKKTLYQKVMRNKIEFEVFDSVSGNTYAIGSVNAHGTHFSDAYNIKSGKEMATSICLGFGIERVVHILLNQYYCV